MKLVTYRQSGSALERLGLLLEPVHAILDVQAAYQRAQGGPHPCLGSMQTLIDGGDVAMALVRELRDQHDPADRVDGPNPGQLAAPLPRPQQMRDCLCFEGHLIAAYEKLRARDSATPRGFLERFRTRPFWYKCNRFAVCGPDTVVRWPADSRLMDYECELAMVIGRTARNVPADQARQYVFGYTIFNDLSARDLQGPEMAALGPARSKDFDDANVLGPCIVTPDEFDPYAARTSVRINGELQNVRPTSGMYYTFEDLIEYISQSETLHPGEILCSGTVEGGCGLEQGRLLNPGDTVELEVEGIGVLRNQILASH